MEDAEACYARQTLVRAALRSAREVFKRPLSCLARGGRSEWKQRFLPWPGLDVSLEPKEREDN